MANGVTAHDRCQRATESRGFWYCYACAAKLTLKGSMSSRIRTDRGLGQELVDEWRVVPVPSLTLLTDRRDGLPALGRPQRVLTRGKSSRPRSPEPPPQVEPPEVRGPWLGPKTCRPRFVRPEARSEVRLPIAAYCPRCWRLQHLHPPSGIIDGTT